MPANDITKIGPYDIVSVLGEGGMGIVYKAVDPRIGRSVAIKLMTAGFSKNEEALKRFFREAQSVGVLQHPNIVVVYDLGDQDGMPYLVMEYLDGESLDKVITSQRELSIVEKLQIIVKILRALNYAHQRKIVHRDVKPGNVMVLSDGDCKLVDFGIARMGDANLTHTGQIVGSMSYMSPEQLNGYDVDGRTDVWSAAVLFYQLLTYHLPFEGRDTSALIVKILSEKPPPLSTYLQNYYPPELDDIIARGLAKDREARYATADEFAFDLEHVESLLKAQMVSEYVEQARASMDSDLTRARELLSRVLKVDTQNSTAKQMLYQVQQLMHQQQRVDQTQVLRSRAEEALSKSNWEDALALVDQALKIDQTSLDLVGLRETILQRKSRKEQVLKLVHLAEAAQRAGEVEMARRAVDDALSLDPNDTQARVLSSALVREIEQRHRFEELLQSVRKEVTSARFESAARMLREAEALRPQATEIAPLKNLIAAGREDQIRAERFENLKREAQQLLANGQFVQAQAKSEEALRYDSANRGMLDLLDQIKTQQQNHWVAQQLASAEKLVAEGRITAALTLIETASIQSRDPRLQKKIPELRQQMELHRRSAALAASITAANSALQHEGHATAISILERASVEFGHTPEITDLLKTVRASAAETTRRRQIAEMTQKAQRLMKEGDARGAEALLSKAQDFDPGDESVAPLLALARAQREQQEIDTARSQSEIEAAGARQKQQELEARQRAQQEQQQAEARQRALREQQELEAKRAQSAPAAGSEPRVVDQREPVKEVAPPTPPQGWSATRLFSSGGSAAAPPPDVFPDIPPATPPPQATTDLKPPLTPVGEADVPMPPASPAPRSSKVWIAGGVAAALILAAALFMFLRPSALVAVRFETEPAGAEVSADGSSCKAPCALNLKPGDHSVRAVLDGYDPVEKQVSVGTVTQTVAISLAALHPVLASVKVQANVDAVDVLVDGVLKGVSTGKSITLNLVPGNYKIRAEKSGYDAAEQSVTVGKDAVPGVQLTLNKASGPAQPARDPYVMITAKPGAKVVIDGKQSANVPSDGIYSTQLKPGKHRVEVDLGGYEPWSSTVNVNPGETVPVRANLKEIPKPPASVVSFTAASGAIQQGQSTELRWQTLNAREVVIDHGVGNVSPAGSHQVSPVGSTTYTLTAKGEGQPVQSSVTITVAAAPVPKPSIALFETGADKVEQGQGVKLSWATQNANEVSIDQGVGPVEASGSREVRPGKSATYTLTAKGQGGSTSRSVQVSVTEKPVSRPAEPVVAENPDFNAVRHTIEQRYKEAYESMVIGDLVSVWPTISKQQKDAINNSFKMYKRISASYTCAQPVITGDKARCTCKESVTYITNDMKRQGPLSASFIFDLKKSSGTWYVENRHAQ
jgi:serine/threonine-protein kinase